MADNAEADAIPAIVLPSGQFLVIAATASGFFANHPGYAGPLVSLEGIIGDGLINAGDRVLLLAPDGTLIDAMSYGSDTGIFDPPCPDVDPGWSLARVPPDEDTNTRADWLPQATPHPGLPLPAPTATPTSTEAPTRTPTMTVTLTATEVATSPPDATPTTAHTPTPTSTATLTPTAMLTPTCTTTPAPTATATPWPRVRLNEVLPRPMSVDWDGNGVANAYDEWIEVYNLEPYPIDLGGWALDDMAFGGTSPYIFPPGTVLEPMGFLVRHRSGTGVALNQDADTARLLAPDGLEVDAFSYTNPTADRSYSRAVDGFGEWMEGFSPSPGFPEHRAASHHDAVAHTDRDATSTHTLTPTATPTPTRT